jgi:hypothetical protein
MILDFSSGLLRPPLAQAPAWGDIEGDIGEAAERDRGQAPPFGAAGNSVTERR